MMSGFCGTKPKSSRDKSLQATPSIRSVPASAVSTPQMSPGERGLARAVRGNDERQPAQVHFEVEGS